MFIFNLKINGNKLFKIVIFILILISLVITSMICYDILLKPNYDSSKSYNNICKINESNYTNVLKEVHDNIDKYIDKQIDFVGYVYRDIDFNQNQFVLARDMVVSSDFKTVVVGFLCEEKSIKEYEDGCWIHIQGKIAKGNYHGEMPVIKINKIEKTKKPQEEYVYPPDDSFVVTSNII